jgi:hypothetical protein
MNGGSNLPIMVGFENYNSTSPLCHLLRLSFDTYDEACLFRAANDHMLSQIWLWHETLGDREGTLSLHGICDLCERQTQFQASPHKVSDTERFRFRVDWWSDTLCDCQMSNLDRAAVRVLFDGMRQEDRIYHVGHHSRFRRWLSERIPNVIASQYAEDRKPGEIDNDIRYEDLTALSFDDEEFDIVICMEILEHLPNYISALHEMKRILRPGGRALLTFPWLGGDNYDHLVRAKLLPDGSIHHLLPPEYHGDPANSEGILSFRAFGWRILDELREAGFSRASAHFVFGPLHGYMQLLNPVIVGER